MLYSWGLLTIALLLSGKALALDCGTKTNPCKIASGEYHIAVPPGWQGGPAIMHLHGYGGSGAKIIGREGFVKRLRRADTL